MTYSETEQLVGETMELTGSDAPEVMREDAPVLRDRGTGADGIYLVGLIGGKEVGKSALVNALAGASISEETSHGPGTEEVVAYVHRPRQEELRALLEREAGTQFRIVPHDQARLGAQVLLDLPDIDSRFSPHIELTRRILRQMLFPIWIQSVEKYADAQPQNLLAKVAAGNDPGNFLFCLNKADQLTEPEQRNELREDYGKRVARVLGLAEPPRVFMISAREADSFDLPELSRLLSREKSVEAVSRSRELAGRRRQSSLLAWLDKRDLPGRALQLGRLDEQASELLSQRIGVPLLETTVPAILDDPAYRRVMTDGVFARRVARWPIINVLDAALAPLRMIIRQNAATASAFGGAEALVDGHLTSAHGSPARCIQAAFAQLHQSDPTVAALFGRRKLWESMEADIAEARLRQELIDTVQRQRQMVLSRLSGRLGIVTPLLRILLTVGALIWFPFVQPVLEAVLGSHSVIGSARDAAVLAVRVLNGTSLLENALFLLLWYLMIWSLLRWGTRQRVDRLLSRWKTAKHADPALNLTTTALQWIDDLLEPIRAAKETTQRLVERVESLRKELKGTMQSGSA